jgi:hypothetical protein
MCINITCENKGICVASHLSWSCRCSSSFYSGQFCQDTSSTLEVKQKLSKSFASIAIIAIITLYLFVLVMDVLKYGFEIDPVDRERQRMKKEQEKRQLNKKKHKKRTKKPRFEFHHVT